MTDRTDIAAWTAPLDETTPSGPDLEYDAAFMALERAVAPRGERIVRDGGEAEAPDWDRLLPSATALLDRSRDLRVAVTLSSGWLAQHGLAGWSGARACAARGTACIRSSMPTTTTTRPRASMR